MDQVLFDSLAYNGDAWANTLDYLNGVKPDAVVLSGALTRTDRPEIKMGDLTHWDSEKDLLSLVAKFSTKKDSGGNEVQRENRHDFTQKEMNQIMRSSSGERFLELFDLRDKYKEPSSAPLLYDSVESDMSREFKIAKSRFRELRGALGDDTDIYYAFSQDDGFSANRLSHYYATSHGLGLKTDVGAIESEISELKREEKKWKKAKDKVKRGSKRSFQAEIDKIRSKIRIREARLAESESERSEFDRPRKESAPHQIFASAGYHTVADQYKKILDRYGMKYLHRQSILDLGDSRLLFKAKDGSTDAPKKSSPKELNDSLNKKVRELLANDIRFFVQGGEGKFWHGRFDEPATAEEINNSMRKTWQPGLSTYGDSVYALMLPVCHDQRVIADIFRQDSELMQNRFGGRAPNGNRKHYAVNMFEQGGASGLIGFVTDGKRPGIECISYDKLLKGIPRIKYWSAVEVQADRHSGSPNSAYELDHGDTIRREKALEESRDFRGKNVNYVSLLDAGDDGEGNTSGWRGSGAEHPRRTPDEIMRELQILVGEGGLSNVDEFSLMNYLMGIAREGSYENLSDIQRWTDKHYSPEVTELAERSDMKTVFSAVKGNHFYLSSRPTGISALDHFLVRMDERGLLDRIQIDERPSRSLMRFVKDFGKTVSGDDSEFDAFNLYLHHDPPVKGGDLVYDAAAKAQENGGDMSMIGHYHLSAVGAVRRRDKPNVWLPSVAAPSQTRVSSTDSVKMGRKRNAGSISLYFPKYEDGSRRIESGEVGHFVVFDNHPRYLAEFAAKDLYKRATGREYVGDSEA